MNNKSTDLISTWEWVPSTAACCSAYLYLKDYPELGVGANASDPNTEAEKKNHCEFKAILGYTNVRPAWAIV